MENETLTENFKFKLNSFPFYEKQEKEQKKL